MKNFLSLIIVIIIFWFTGCSPKVKPEVTTSEVITSEVVTSFTNSFGPIITCADSTNSMFHFLTFTLKKSADQLEVSFLKDSLTLEDSYDRVKHSFYVPRKGSLLNYRIKSKDPLVDKTSGRIFSPDSLPFLVAISGDFDGNIEVSRRILESIGNKNPALFIQLGNITSGKIRKEEFGDFFLKNKAFFTSIPFAPVYGEKDIDIEDWKELFGLSGKGGYYSINLPETKILVLNTETLGVGSPQYVWLTNELEKSWNLWKVVAMHKPIYSSCKNQDEGIKGMHNILEPLFERYRVNIVLCGHDHIYERYEKNKVVYITSGCGGAPFDSIVMSNDYRLASAERLHHYVLLKIGRRRIAGVVCSIDRIPEKNDPLSFKVASGDVERRWGDYDALEKTHSLDEISMDTLNLDMLVSDTMILDTFEIIE